jgi:O-antigen/teichoic acid export membrane protein
VAGETMFRPTLVLMSGRILSFAATFFIPVVLVRIFNPGEFGTYKQVFLVYGTVYGVAQLGMAESLFYFLPRDPAKGGRYVLNSILVLLFAGLACLGLLSQESSRISALLSNRGLAQYVPLLGLYLLLMIASATLEIVMISRKQYLWAAVSYALSDLLRATLLITPAFLFRDLHWILLGSVAFAVIRFGFALIYFQRQFGGEFKLDLGLLRQQLAYCLPFEMAVLLDIFQSNFHQYAVSHYFNAATFAIYSVGCLQIPLIDFLASPACNVMMVQMSEEIREDRGGAVIAIWHEMTRKLALVFFPLFGLLLVAARDLIVFLFTGAYAASVPIFMVWSATLLLATLQTDGVLRVYAETRFIFALGVLRLVLIAALIYACLSVFGLLGAVIVTILALGLGKGLALIRMRRLMQVRASELLPWRSLAVVGGVTLAASLIAWGVQSMLEVPPLVRLMVAGLVFAVSYLALLLRFGLLSDRERLALTSWLQRFTTAVSPGGRIQKQLEGVK